MNTSPSRTRLTGTALTLATVLAAGLAAPAGAAAPASTGFAQMAQLGVMAGTSTSCSTDWGSLAERKGTSHTTGTVSNVRSGRHTCFDRMVIDVADVPRSLSYDVRYVTQVREDGSGKVIPLAGGARLRIILRAPAYDDEGQATYTPADKTQLTDVDGYRTFRQLAWAGSLEGQSTVGLGVRARLPFRVMVLDGPGAGARLVVDVAHRW